MSDARIYRDKNRVVFEGQFLMDDLLRPLAGLHAAHPQLTSDTAALEQAIREGAPVAKHLAKVMACLAVIRSAVAVMASFKSRVDAAS